MNTKTKEKAKSKLIEDVHPEPSSFKRFGDKIRAKCPFHKDEKEPNLFIYTATNTFYCFKCGIGGDVITFYMKLHDCDFKEAIKKLK